MKRQHKEKEHFTNKLPKTPPQDKQLSKLSLLTIFLEELIGRETDRTRWRVRIGVRVIGILGVFIISQLFSLFYTSLNTCRHLNFAQCFTLEPPPPSSGDTVIVVAGFAFQIDDHGLVQDRRADDLSLSIAKAIKELEFVDDVLDINDWRVPRILDSTAEARERQALELGNNLNADIVIYGIVTDEGNAVTFLPEFYVAPVLNREIPELTELLSTSQPIRSFVRNPVQSRLQVEEVKQQLALLWYFVDGMTLYIEKQYDKANASFQLAIDSVPSDSSLAFLYVYHGNTNLMVAWEGTNYNYDLRRGRLHSALESYQRALILIPNYPRALIGRGAVFFKLAELATEQGAFAYDPNLTLPQGTTCLTDDGVIPSEAQLLAMLAIKCYNLAQSSSKDETQQATIAISATFGLGSVYAWLSDNKADLWGKTYEFYDEVITLYNATDSDQQAWLQLYAGHAYARRGGALLVIGPQDCRNLQEIIDSYQIGINLLDEGTLSPNTENQLLKSYKKELEVRRQQYNEMHCAT